MNELIGEENDKMTDADLADLARLETHIDRAIAAYRQAGLALKEIRDRRLYRHQFGTFEDYVEVRWNMTRSRAYHMIRAAEVAEQLLEDSGFAGMELGAAVRLPEGDGQARQLLRIPEDQRSEVWNSIIEVTTEEKLTRTRIDELLSIAEAGMPTGRLAEVVKEREEAATARAAAIKSDDHLSEKQKRLKAGLSHLRRCRKLWSGIGDESEEGLRLLQEAFSWGEKALEE